MPHTECFITHAPGRIANARRLAELAPQLPGDDFTARETLAGITILLGGRWVHPEAAALGAIRLAGSSPSKYLRQLAAGVLCSLHGRSVACPSSARAGDAAGIAALVSFLPGGDWAAREALYDVATLLTQVRPAVDRALSLALEVANSGHGGDFATLARAVALTLCAPTNEVMLAEIGCGPFELTGGAVQ